MEVIGLKEVRYKSHNGKEHTYKFEPRNYDFNKDCVGKESLRKIVIYGELGSGKSYFLKHFYSPCGKNVNITLETHSKGIVNYDIDSSFINMMEKDCPKAIYHSKMRYHDPPYDAKNIFEKMQKLYPILNKYSIKESGGKNITNLFSILNFIHRCKENRPSIMIIDDFCNTFTDSMALYIMSLLKDTDIPFIISTNKTCLMDSDILRPDCYFIMDREKGLSNICDLTDKELRQGHNLEKLYRAGGFNNNF